MISGSDTRLYSALQYPDVLEHGCSMAGKTMAYHRPQRPAKGERPAHEPELLHRDRRRVLVGVVTSDKMNKTRRVEVPRLVKHPRYGKYVRRRTVCHVHDEKNESRRGDTVEIMETRPLSKTKHWRLLRVVARREPLTLPQGLTEREFADLSAKIRVKAGSLGADICVHGSRAAGTARPDSDLDIAIRVSSERFEEILDEKFKNVNPGTAKERTMLHARAHGKIQTGEIGLSGLRRELERQLGKEVQISVIRLGGPFDRGPFIPLMVD
jgi:ribosomal protein uS17